MTWRSTSLTPPAWLAIGVFCLGLGTGVGLTTWGLGARYAANVSALKLDQERQVSAARADDLETLKQARRHGDTLTLQLQVTESNLTQKEKALHDALRTQTTGRACLTGRVVSLLNNAGTTDHADALPAPASSPAATDESAASDTDVAQWAANARAQYDICRARLNALIDW